MCIKIPEIPTIEVSYKKNHKGIEAVQIEGSRSTYEVLKSKWDFNTIELYEEFKVLYLDRANNVLGIRNLTKGTTTQTLIDFKLLFSIALVSNASGIIISHNHPSGTLRPSRQDITVTKKIKEIGKLLEVTLLDHLIVTVDGYFSFNEEDMI